MLWPFAANIDLLFSQGVFSNKPLLGAVCLTFVLQLAILYVPPLQGIFDTTALPISDLLVCLALSSLYSGGVELEKFWQRRKQGVWN
jgi:Ca2+-transporting ATPase